MVGDAKHPERASFHEQGRVGQGPALRTRHAGRRASLLVRATARRTVRSCECRRAVHAAATCAARQGNIPAPCCLVDEGAGAGASV
eukprot:7785853-Alexandrium_andersonii.AAC.1